MLNFPEIDSILNELNNAILADYDELSTINDLPYGHPCIHPENFFEWLIQIIDLCINLCEENKPDLDYETNFTVLKSCLRKVYSIKDCIRIYDLIDDGIEEKIKMVERKTELLSEEIRKDVEEFKNLYISLFGNNNDTGTFDFHEIDCTLGEHVPYEIITYTIVKIIVYIYDYLNIYYKD